MLILRPPARNLTNSEKVRTVIYDVPRAEPDAVYVGLNERDRQRLCFKDRAFEKDYKFLQKKLPNREIGFDSSTADEMTWLISAVSGTEPGEKYLFDRKSKKLELHYRIREKLPRNARDDLISLLESMPATMKSERIRVYKRVGDPTTAGGKAQLTRQSPLAHADEIKTPLLVVQGASEVRVKKRQADQIVISLRDRGFPVEYVVAPDEGQGFARPVNIMATLAMTEKFLAQYLGGRYQESLTPEVAKRLQEITVDPKTVKLAANPTGK